MNKEWLQENKVNSSVVFSLRLGLYPDAYKVGMTNSGRTICLE